MYIYIYIYIHIHAYVSNSLWMPRLLLPVVCPLMNSSKTIFPALVQTQTHFKDNSSPSTKEHATTQMLTYELVFPEMTFPPNEEYRVADRKLRQQFFGMS